ncbi:unnamed protein product [Sphagnum balticum]
MGYAITAEQIICFEHSSANSLCLVAISVTRIKRQHASYAARPFVNRTPNTIVTATRFVLNAYGWQSHIRLGKPVSLGWTDNALQLANKPLSRQVPRARHILYSAGANKSSRRARLRPATSSLFRHSQRGRSRKEETPVCRSVANSEF